jgi:peptidoglycan/xylan/chitin deacetylase (PgdA/CDA1 family)
MILNGHVLGAYSPGLMKMASRAFASASDENEDRHCNTLLPLLWTFDDGLEDLLAIDERLRGDFGVHFRFFICPQLVDQYSAGQAACVQDKLENRDARLLSWDQIGRLHEKGHVLGLHGNDHSDFNAMSAAEMADQHESSIHMLHQRLGIKTDSFAVPFGRVDAATSNVIPVAKQYYRRIYLSDNRLAPKRHAGVYNRRHSEFGNTVLPSVLKGVLQHFYRG